MEDDYEPRYPQDALDSSDRDIDPLSAEENEDLAKELHRDPHDIEDRFARTEDPDSEESEDLREQLEDVDQET